MGSVENWHGQKHGQMKLLSMPPLFSFQLWRREGGGRGEEAKTDLSNNQAAKQAKF
jgi:hypothetical protein